MRPVREGTGKEAPACPCGHRAKKARRVLAGAGQKNARHWGRAEKFGRGCL